MESPPRDTVYDHFREPLKDVSFYDQPDEFSTMISPGAGALSDTSTISRRSSISSLSSEAESTCSSVDKVFFGPTSVKERTLIAKLSRVDLKGSNTVQVEEESGRENSIRRLVRRDSKEFHRRRTLGFSQRANLPNTPRRWADGFYLKDQEAPYQSTPVSHSLKSFCLPSPPPSPSPLQLLDDIQPEAESSGTSSSHAYSRRGSVGSVDSPYRLPSSATATSIRQGEEELVDEEEFDVEAVAVISESQDEEDEEDREPIEDLSVSQSPYSALVVGDEEVGQGVSLVDGLPADVQDETAAERTQAESEDIASIRRKEDLPVAEQSETLEASKIDQEDRDMQSDVQIERDGDHARILKEAEEPVGVPVPTELALAQKETHGEEEIAIDITPEPSIEADGLPEIVSLPASGSSRRSLISFPAVSSSSPLENDTPVQSSCRRSSRLSAKLDLKRQEETLPEQVHEEMKEVEIEHCDKREYSTRRLVKEPIEASDLQAITVEREEGSLEAKSETTDQVEADVPENSRGLSESLTEEDLTEGRSEEVSDATIAESTVTLSEKLIQIDNNTPSRNTPLTPSSSDAGETTFDPESPLPICRAPKPEMMMPGSLEEHDNDILPFNRKPSLSPVAHASGLTTFHIGSFDLAKETMHGSTMRIRQAVSPEACRPSLMMEISTPIKKMSTFNNASLMASMQRPDTLVHRSAKKERAEEERAKKVANQLDLFASRSNPFLASTSTPIKAQARHETKVATPAKSRTQSSRLSQLSPKSSNCVTHHASVPIASGTEEAPTKRLSNETAKPVTPRKAPALSATTSTPSKPLIVPNARDSKLKQPTKSLLKKPSASLLPIFKNISMVQRPTAVAPVAKSLPTFDFVQPLPPVAKMTSYAPATKSRQVMPLPLKSPARHQDIFSSPIRVPPVRPIKAPMLSSSTGPAMRPNMTPVRIGVRSFGSPMRSQLSPVKSLMSGTPQRAPPSLIAGTPQAIMASAMPPQPMGHSGPARRLKLANSIAENISIPQSKPLMGSTVHRANRGSRAILAVASAEQKGSSVGSRAPSPTGVSLGSSTVEPTSTPIAESLPLPEAVSAVQTSEVSEPIPVAPVTSTSRRSARPTRTPVSATGPSAGKDKDSKVTSKSAEKKSKPKADPKPVPKVSDADLQSVTKLNTARNEVIFSAITTIKQRRPGPRPRGDPLTIAEKEASMSREERALRRQQEKSSIYGGDECDTPPKTHRQGPGDLEAYTTPARPGKRAREESSSPDQPGPSHKRSRTGSSSSNASAKRPERRVKWDKGLVMITEGPKAPSSAESSSERVRGCLRKTIELDQYGNVINAIVGVPGVQPLPIEVYKLRYDGEDFSDGEPTEGKGTKRPIEKGKGRKKAATSKN